MSDCHTRCTTPRCLYEGCTGASVRDGDRFCSELCARLFGEQEAERYSYCVACDEWHDETCERR